MRLIDADAMLDRFNEKCDMATALIDDEISKRFHKFCVIADALEDCPTIDAEPVRHGHWIRKPHWCVSCSYCGKYTHDYEGEAELYNYCPNCGADMRGGHIE